mgnify:CR=1 FL=1
MIFGFLNYPGLLPYGGVVVLIAMLIFVMEIFLTIKKVKHLQTMPNDTCFNLLFPSSNEVIDNNLFDQDLINKEVEIFNKLLKAPSLRKILSEDELFLLIGPIYIKLNETYESELISLENPNNTNINKAKTCDLIVELYTEIMKLPTEDAGAVLRTMFAMQ